MRFGLASVCGIDGPKNSVAELWLVMRLGARVFCDWGRGRVAGPKFGRVRRLGEPTSAELDDEDEVRRPRIPVCEGKATELEAFFALNTGVGA